MNTLYGHQLKSKNSHRAAVMLYSISPISHKIWFLTGLDSKYNEITDIGGGVKKYDKTLLHSAFRELEEETHEIFNPFVSYQDLLKCVVLQSNFKKPTKRQAIIDPSYIWDYEQREFDMTTVFVPLSWDIFEQASQKFEATKLDPKFTDVEIEKLVMLSESNFKRITKRTKKTNNFRMWHKLMYFYSTGYTDKTANMIKAVWYDKYKRWYPSRLRIMTSLPQKEVPQIESVTFNIEITVS